LDFQKRLESVRWNMSKAILLLLLAALSLGAVAPKEGPTGVQFVVRVIEASSDPGAKNDAAGDVPAELKELLKHTAYTQVGVAILRGREVEFTLGSLVGEIDAKIVDGAVEQAIEFDIELHKKVEVPGEAEDEDNYDLETIIETSDVAKDGETVVLGASSVPGGGESVIVLMTVKIIR
jgi:hypothetical protein